MIDILSFTGQLYSKSGRAVQISSSDKVVLSSPEQDATVFLFVRCRAWNTVTQSLRPLCYSLVDAQRSDRYVRHYGYYLRLDSEHDPTNPSYFDNDCSFVFHEDTFYTGYYALESVNFPNYYIKSDPDGRLLITQRSDTADYNDTASFRISEYMSGKCQYAFL